MPSSPDHCKNCMMPILQKDGRADAGESDVSYLFASMHCLCDAPRLNAQAKGESAEFCKRCNKRKPDPSSRPGSLTSFLFAATRCQCDSALTSGKRTTGPHDLTSIVVPTSVDRKKNIARTKMVQQNKTRLFSRTQTFIANDSTRTMLSLQAGQTIGGAYQLLDQIGEGGMGKVYEARHTVLNRPCAIKFLMPEMVSETSWQMFKNEARILNSLNHPGICKIYDLGLHQNALPFLAMELIDGITLEQYLARFGPLSTGAALQLAASAARTLAYAHRHNILHRDLKPGNIMLARTQKANQGDVGVKILDFGISQTMVQDESAQSDGDIVGSAFYMSPEQFRGDNLTASSDIYSLGCTLFECLTGRPPYDAEEYADLSEMHQGADVPTIGGATGLTMSPDLEAIISHCLQKHTIKRYKNMSELAVDCEKLLQGKALQFAHVENEEPKARKIAKNNGGMSGDDKRTIAIVSSGVVLCAVALGAAYHEFNKAAPRQQQESKTAGTLDEVQPKDLRNAINKVSKEHHKKYKKTAVHEDLDEITRQDRLSEEERKIFWADKSTIGQLQTIDGKQYWVIDLPRHYEIGKLTYTDKDKNYAGGPAHGRFVIPQACKIGLALDEEPGLAEIVLPRMHPDCLDSVTVSKTELPSLQALQSWTRLKKLGYYRSKVGAQVSRDIAALRQLKSLFLDGCTIDINDLRTILAGKDLAYLSLHETVNDPMTARILPAIEANKHLYYLSINFSDDPKVMERLAKMRQLDTIKIHLATVNERQVGDLSTKFAPIKLDLDFDMSLFGPSRFKPLQAKYKNLKLSPSQHYALDKNAIDDFLN